MALVITLLCCSVDIWYLLIMHTCNVLCELYITQTARMLTNTTVHVWTKLQSVI